MDNRLDFINKIEDNGLAIMNDMRSAFIQLDDILRGFANNPAKPLTPASARTLALARTNLEIALQFTIKTLCIQYEIKKESE